MSIKLLTAFLIGVAVGLLSMMLFLTPRVAKLKADVIKINAFSECIESKIMGQEDYRELILLDVISCFPKTLE